MNKKKLDYINTLLNIDNFTGEHSGRVLPWVIFLLVAFAPIIAFLFVGRLMDLMGIPMKPVLVIFIVFEICWAFRWFLILPGREKERLASYKSRKMGKYKSAAEIVHLSYVYDNGITLYSNGAMALFFGGFLKGYTNPKKLSLELEDFLNGLNGWTYDMFFYQDLDFNINAELPKLKAYSDRTVISDRIEFFNEQRDYVANNGRLYKLVFKVNVNKTNWKTALNYIKDLVDSDAAQCFNELSLFSKDEVYEVINRDIAGHIDINKMLLEKYSKYNLRGSKVLWFDDEVPEEFKKDFYEVVMEERRQVDYAYDKDSGSVE